jgi:hypothetical protein
MEGVALEAHVAGSHPNFQYVNALFCVKFASLIFYAVFNFLQYFEGNFTCAAHLLTYV